MFQSFFNVDDVATCVQQDITHTLETLRILWLGGGFKHFLFSPLPGEIIQFDEHIFQMGWNHQLVDHCLISFFTLPKPHPVPSKRCHQKVSQVSQVHKTKRSCCDVHWVCFDFTKINIKQQSLQFMIFMSLFWRPFLPKNITPVWVDGAVSNRIMFFFVMEILLMANIPPPPGMSKTL